MDLLKTLGDALKPEDTPEEVKASIVVMSHLSDAQEFLTGNCVFAKDAKTRINFAKYIIFHTGGDLTKKINPDQLWSEFNKPVKTLKS